jgi:sugar lactone lactonase YvrE
MASYASAGGIFVSYASQDRVTANLVAHRLKQAGFDCFFDVEAIAGGAAWEQELHRALRSSRALVLCASPASADSKWVWVEVMIARHLGLPVIPLRVQGDVVPELLKQTTQTIDCTTDPERGFEKLLAALHGLPASPSTTGASARARPSQPDPALALRVVAGARFSNSPERTAARAAQLGSPGGIALGEDASLYIGDMEESHLYRLSRAGELTIFHDTAYRPAQVAVDGNALFVASLGRHVVQRLSLTTREIETVAGIGEAGPAVKKVRPGEASFCRPLGVAVSAGSVLYVADSGNHCIRRVSLASDEVLTIVGNGTRGYSGDGGPAEGAQLNSPGFLTLSPAEGALYFSDAGNHCIRRIRFEDNEITTVVGTGRPGFSADGSKGIEAAISDPRGLVITGLGLAFADSGNHRIRLLRHDGTLATLAGTGEWSFSGDARDATRAELFAPSGLAFDVISGRLFVADTGHGQVKVLGEVDPWHLDLA